jgi:hypothetical protein
MSPALNAAAAQLTHLVRSNREQKTSQNVGGVSRGLEARTAMCALPTHTQKVFRAAPMLPLFRKTRRSAGKSGISGSTQ